MDNYFDLFYHQQYGATKCTGDFLRGEFSEIELIQIFKGK